MPSYDEFDPPEQFHFLYRALCLQQHLHGPTVYDKLWLYHRDAQATGWLVLTLIAEELGIVRELPSLSEPFQASVKALEKIESEIAAGRFPKHAPRKDLPEDKPIPAKFDLEAAIRHLHTLGWMKIDIPLIPNLSTQLTNSNLVYLSAICGRCGFNLPDNIMTSPESFVFRLWSAARLI